MDRPIGQRLISEAVGTFTLIFIGAGSILASDLVGLQSGTFGAGVGGAGLLMIALAHGLAIGVMVTAVGHISGGHFNPAVTLAVWVTRRIGSGAAAAYIVTQLAAASLGAFALRLLVPGVLWGPSNIGTPTVTQGIESWQAIAIEAVLTFLLVWVVFATAVDPAGAFGKIAGLAIGLTIAMDIMMGGPFTGAAMNPARWFGPAAVSGEVAAWWVYLLGPILGGTVAALLYDLGVLKRPA